MYYPLIALGGDNVLSNFSYGISVGIKMAGYLTLKATF